MKYVLVILTVLLMGCGGSLTFGKDRVVFKNGRLSCVGLRCCYPYGENEKLMICNQGTSNGDGVFIRYRYGQ